MRIARALLVLAVLLVPASARAQFARWSQDQNATDSLGVPHKLYGLPIADRDTGVVRRQDVAAGACIPKSTGANTLPFICSVPETDYITPAYTFGGDLSGTPASANVIGVTVAGPTHLTFGPWADGTIPKRSGTTIIGATPGTDYLVPGVTAAGNYDRVSVAASGLVTGGAALVAANITALEALTGANYRDGNRAYVTSLQREFVYHVSSSATVDHITVASASGASGARWIADSTPWSVYWNATAWFVDPANVSAVASDQNTGTSSGAPLRTFAELGRRLYGAQLASGNLAITQMSPAPQSDPLIMRGVSTTGFTFITLTGTPTVIASGRTISAVRSPAITANDHFEITDAAGISGFVQNYLLHKTNGTQAWFWGYKDLGSNKLQISVPMTTAGSPATLAPGDTYEVLDPPNFADLLIEPVSSGGFIFYAVQKVRALGATNVGAPAPGGPSQWDRCAFPNTGGIAFGHGIDVVSFTNVMVPASAGGINFLGRWGATGGLYAGNGTTTQVFFSEGYTLGGLNLPMTLGGAFLSVSHDARFEKLQVMVYDWTGVLPAILVSHRSYALITGLGGERNTAKLVGADTFSQVGTTDGFTSWNSAITTDATPYQVGGNSYAAVDLGTATNQLATKGMGIVNYAGAWTGDLSGVGSDPSVVAIHETSGPTKLTIGAVPDLGYLLRSGTTVTGSTTIPYSVITGAPAAITSLSTDVVATGPGAATATIQPGVVTNPKLANMTAPAFKGRTTAGPGDPEDLTATQATAMLSVFSSTLKGLAPASGGGTTTFLRADGTYAVPPGTGSSGITQLTGDGTAGPGSGSQVFALSNIPSGTTMGGSLLATAIAAPSTPAAGKGSVYFDSTSKNLASKGDAGVVNHGVQTRAATTHQFLTAISDAGGVSAAAPDASDLTGFTASRIPFANGTGLTDSAKLQYNGVGFGFGSLQEVQVFNDSTNATAFAGLMVGTDAAYANSFTVGMTGTTWSGGSLAPNVGLAELVAGSAPIIISNFGTGKISFTTTSSRTERFSISTGGTVTVSNLTTGMVKATAGALGMGVAGVDFQAAGNYLLDPGNNGALYRTSSGVTAALNGTAGAVPYFSSTGVLGQDAGNFAWDGTLHGLNIGGGTLVSGEAVRVSGKTIRVTGTNSANLVAVENTANTTGAYAELGLINNRGSGSRASIYYTSQTYTGSETFPDALAFSTAPGATAHITMSPNNTLTLDLVPGKVVLPSAGASTISVALTRAGDQVIEKQGTGDLYLGTKSTQLLGFYTNNVERADISSAGVFRIANLAGTGTRVVGADASGNVTIASTANIATALSMPDAGRVLAGNTGGTGFDASDEVRINSAADFLMISNDGSFVHQNDVGNLMVGAPNYERIRSFWSSNVWNLASEKGGTGTVVRPMKIDAGASTLTLAGSEVRASTLAAGGYVGTDVNIGTGELINVTPTAEFNYFIEIFTGSTLIALNAADQYIATSSNTDIFGSTAVEYPLDKTVPSYYRIEACLVGANTITSGEVSIGVSINGSAGINLQFVSSSTGCLRTSGTNFGGAATDKLGVKLMQSSGIGGRDTAVMSGTLRLSIKLRASPLSTF